MRISDETLQAYVDGELDVAEKDRVEAAARTDAALARRIQAQRRLREQLIGAFSDLVAEPPPDALLEAIRSPGSTAPVLNLGEARSRRASAAKPSPRPSAWRRWGAVAACLILVAAAAMFRFAPNGAAPGGPMIGGPPGTMVAGGVLATALDQQLASTGAQPGQTVRIGVSFKSTDGRDCRTFEITKGAGLAGLACRERASWRIRMALASPASASSGTAYRQAGSQTPPPILTAVDRLIDGAPFDAKTEAAARAKGWRP
jgi:hypothetical protein